MISITLHFWFIIRILIIQKVLLALHLQGLLAIKACEQAAGEATANDLR
jgi:hypothetical protein